MFEATRIIKNSYQWFQVLSPPSTSYHPLTSPSSPSYFSTNSSSTVSNTGESMSSGNYGPSQATFPRNQSYLRQQARIMSPNLTGIENLQSSSNENAEPSRVSFISQSGKHEMFSATNLFPKVTSNFFPSVRFNSSSSSAGLLSRNVGKDDMMWMM